jgi:signal transduction histidine kinase
MKRMLDERGIPILLLSATNGQELRNKAALAGAADYLLKNKLNYFYLPRVIVSAIRTHAGAGRGGDQAHDISHARLLDRVREAVIVVNETGQVAYSNNAAKLMLADAEVQAILKRFVSFKNERKEFKAAIEIQGALYDLKIRPMDWAGQPCTAIHLQKSGEANILPTDAKVNLLGEFIQSCRIPFILLVDGLIQDANDSFTDMVKADRGMLKGKPLHGFIETDGDEDINLLKPSRPEMVCSMMGAHISTPLELLRKTVVSGEQQITICSLSDPAQGENQLLNPHRLMEIASHDLREPVRTSLNYLHLLTEGLKKEADNTKLLSYAETVTDEINRAERMIMDMKLLLNMTDKAPKLQKVNMMAIVQDVLRQLKAEIDISDAMVNVSEMPDVKADPTDIKRLLYHLMDNALKFRKKDKRPYIEILAARDGSDWQFCIKDNGIGIDAKYHEAIFEPFRKLNRVDEYPGAGNGLCICRHIVEMHKGRIWLESHEGFGSSFFFTLRGA